MLPVTWSPALGLKSLGDIDRRLTEPWDVSFELRNGNTGATVQSCAEYLAFRGQRVGVEPESDGPSLMRISVDCLAIDGLRNAKPARLSSIGMFHLTMDVLRLLPPELGPVVSDDDEARVSLASRAGLSWKAESPNATVHAGENDEIIITEPHYITRLSEMARADFSGGGRQQVMIRSLTEGINSSWTSARLFLLDQEGTDVVITVRKRYEGPGFQR